MYTKGNYPFKIMFSWTRRGIITFFFTALIPVILFDIFNWKWLTLPWLPIGLVGTALAFITGFKNNAAYDRAWEARQIYGAIVNSSRKFVMMLNDYITPEYANDNVKEDELFAVRQKMVHYHVAWLTCLRYNLRQSRPWEVAQTTKEDILWRKTYKIYEFVQSLEENLKPHLAHEDFEYVWTKTNKATACLKLQSNYLKELKSKGYVEHFRHIEMANIIGELIDSQGRAERIKNFPYPRQFATLNNLILLIFIILLPFGIMSEFHQIGRSIELNSAHSNLVLFIQNHFVWLTIPFSMAVSWIFYTIERTGDVTENPFVGVANDVPITTISRAIEIEMLELIGEDVKNIPEPIPTFFDIQM
ncbi:MAG: bestrophin family ion channel [Bacteroidota bacterium]